MAKANPNKLLVEGDEEKRVIPFLMDKFVVWGDRHDEWLVEIKEFGGIEGLLKPGVIEAEPREPGLKVLGIIIDADNQLGEVVQGQRSLPGSLRRIPDGIEPWRTHPSDRDWTSNWCLDHA